VEEASEKWSNTLPQYACSLPFVFLNENLIELANHAAPVVAVSELELESMIPGIPTLSLATTAVVGREFTLSFIKYGIDMNVKWLIMDMPGNFGNFVEICEDALADKIIDNLPRPWPAQTCSLDTNADSDEMAYNGTISKWIKAGSAHECGWYRYLGESFIHPQGDRRGEILIPSKLD
jgi:hypothetical protein